VSERKRKLIEVALPLDAINRESAREKSIRHGFTEDKVRVISENARTLRFDQSGFEDS
jgi:hypothetical protein